MKRLLYLVSTLESCGPTNQLYYIIKHLDRTNFEPYILTLSREPKNTDMEKFKPLNIQILSLNLSRLESFLWAKKKLSKVINNICPNIIHSFGLRPDWLTIGLNIKVISTLRNFPYSDYQSKYGALKGFIMANLHVRTIKKMSNPIACSKSIKDIYSKMLNLNLEYIQNGIDTDKYYPAIKAKKKKFRKQLSLPLNKKIFISTGAFLTRKDPQTIITTFIQRQKQDELLLFLGEGPLLNQCREIAKTNPNITFRGLCSNVIEYIYSSDYFISASLAEGLPNSVLEAMACGIPCLLSDIPPHRELLEKKDQLNFTFPTKSSKDLSSIITQIQKLNYADLSRHSSQLIAQNFSARTMSSKYQKLYIRILGFNN